MNVLLVNTDYSHDLETDQRFQLPLGVLSLASFIKSKLKEVFVKILDFEFEKRQGNTFDKAMDCSVKWDMVGINVHYDNFPQALSIAQKIKDLFPNIPVIFGGVHATACHREIIQNYSFIDGVIRGEGEIPFLMILHNLKTKNPFYCNVQSLTYRFNNEIVVSDEAELLQLQDLPPTDFSLIPLEAYVKHSDFEKNVWMESGRGCRFKCRFCASSFRWRFKTRYFSVNKIITDVNFLLKKGIRNIRFTHDQFLADVVFAKKICAALRQHKEHMTWHCYARVDSLTPEMIHTLASSGCASVFIGFETIAPSLQKKVTKKYAAKKALDVVKMCVDNNISINGNFIFNLPSANEKTLEKDLNFMLELKHIGANNLQTSYLRLMPGSEFFDKKEWHLLQNMPLSIIKSNFLKICLKKDRKRLFAFLLKEGEQVFCNIPAKAIREIASFIIEYFPFSVSYLKNIRGQKIFDIVKEFYKQNHSFFLKNYADVDLWRKLTRFLFRMINRDTILAEILIYEKMISLISFLQGDSKREMMQALDVNSFIKEKKVVFWEHPKKIEIFSKEQKIIIKEV